jgi:micrococcal nuclease
MDSSNAVRGFVALVCLFVLALPVKAQSSPAAAPSAPTTRPAAAVAPAAPAVVYPPFAPGQRFDVLVIHPKSGDTLEVQRPGQYRYLTIKLIGIDAPNKASRDQDGQEPWGTRSQQFLSLLATRKNAQVELDVELRPSDNTLWAYLWLGDKLVNEEIIRNGHAVLDTRPPNVKYVEKLQAAQRQARETNAGIWNPAEPLPESPQAWRDDLQANKHEHKAEVDALRLPGFVAGCLIGNSKSKKFHAPGTKHYDEAKTSKHAVFFKNAQDAAAAGYTAAGK